MSIGGPFGGTVAVAVAVKAGPAVCQAGGFSGLEGIAPGVAAGRDDHGGWTAAMDTGVVRLNGGQRTARRGLWWR